jgi:RimJ/RimL family protein N-acetyltransferase
MVLSSNDQTTKRPPDQATKRPNNQKMEITTTRLRLFPLNRAALEAVYVGNHSRQRPPITLAPDVIGPVIRRAMRAKLQKMSQARLEDFAWYTYWAMVLPETNLTIGLAGFKGEPDMHGEVEIGYGISDAFAGQGYTTEAVRALVNWALAQPECRAVRAVTRRSNRASQRVLEKVGLSAYREGEFEMHWRIRSME